VPACAALAVAVCLAVGGATRAHAEEYVVGAGDLLQVSVFDHPDLSVSARVSPEGQIRFPLIGTVYVAGLSTARVVDVLTARLANGYIVDPQVTVSIQEYRSRKANVVGLANRPGMYEFRGALTLLELLSRAGGPAPEAGSQATLTRRDGTSAAVDLKALLTQGNTALDLEIHDGDTLYIAAAGSFIITGEVRRPGEYRFDEGMTLIRAITLAGGFSERAATDAVKVIRHDGEQERVFDVGVGTAALEVPVRRGDVVVVNVARADVCYVTGEVKSAGAYRCDRDTNVLKAVTLAGGFTDAAARNKIRIVRKVAGQEQIRDKVSLEEPVLPDDIVIVNVERAEVCYVTGEVKNAGAYRCDGETNVLKAVTLAGGFTDAAARNKIRIVRKVAGQEQVRDKVSLEEPVLPDDVLIVPKSFF
jgi:polysaccharide export outer membrane protein